MINKVLSILLVAVFIQLTGRGGQVAYVNLDNICSFYRVGKHTVIKHHGNTQTNVKEKPDVIIKKINEAKG